MSRLIDLSELFASDRLTRTRLADDTGVILDVDTLRAFSLNETGMFLVEAMGEGATTRQQLVDRLVEAFDVDPGTAAADVEQFVEQLAAHLIETRR
jgi:hypothetical protein